MPKAEEKATPATKLLYEKKGRELIDTVDKLFEDRMELGLLRKHWGIPEQAVIGIRDDGELAFHYVDNGFVDGCVPPTVVVDYLCRRITQSENTLAQVSKRRFEAVRIIEEKRVENQTLQAKLKRLEIE